MKVVKLESLTVPIQSQQKLREFFSPENATFKGNWEELHLNLMLKFLLKMNCGLLRKIFCKNQQTVLVLLLQITAVLKIFYKNYYFFYSTIIL